jgi:hypothetical protein
MPEPHIEGGELDAAKETDKDVSIDIDPTSQIYAESADAVIRALQGDSLALYQVKQGLPPLLAGLEAIAPMFPAIAPAIAVIKAVGAKI